MKLLKFGIIIVQLIVGGMFVNPALANSSAQQKSYSSQSDEQRIFDLINREREKRRLYPLSWNPRLSDLARSYSQKMARERFFDHYDNQGNSVSERAKAMRIRGWRLIGENLFMCEGFEKIPEIAVRGWMKSPTHRENILEGDFNQTGIGIARSRDGKIYVTQVFMQS